jgi:MFS family permease
VIAERFVVKVPLRHHRFSVGVCDMVIVLGVVFLQTPVLVLATGAGIAVFGLGFGMVTQILVVAVQNSVERRELGVATAVTGFFRALGGAVGAAVLGAVFAARAGIHASDVAGSAVRGEVIDGVQTVFLVAAPLAALALMIVLLLPELPLKTRADAGGQPRQTGRQPDGRPHPSRSFATSQAANR